jgi:protein-L-isoaspartate(D-aspartate) O-methyltransferase
MVDEEIVAAGVTNERVIRAMRETPRHEFMPTNQRTRAYLDMALPIGAAQTISPPFVVAYMTQELDPQPTDRVLEIGTGSGYQAAVLSKLVREVYSIEIVDSLARKAARTLKRLHYDNVSTRAGDGYLGWPEAAPFDKIIVTCSPESVPEPLIEQLVDGGRMVVPVGERYQQNLFMFRKEGGELVKEALRATLFVPMTGQAEAGRQVLPDPNRPKIANGSFEETLAEDSPSGWHYQRQLTLVTDDPLAPDGQHYVRFSNREAGLAARALQGFAVDGRHVPKLRLTFWVRGTDIRIGASRDQWPAVIVTFYDQRRVILSHEQVGPFDGTFDWRREDQTLDVPLKAREAILRIGLLGAVGEIALDDLRLIPGPS